MRGRGWPISHERSEDYIYMLEICVSFLESLDLLNRVHILSGFVKKNCLSVFFHFCGVIRSLLEVCF